LLLFRAAAGGLLLLGAVTVVSTLVPPNIFTLLLLIVAPIAAYSHFGVNCYRILLLGPEGLIRPALRWDRRHWRFLGYALAMIGALLSLDVALSLVVPFAGPLITLGLLYLAARCSFIFPTLAVEEPYSLALSWRHTQGQGLRLTAVLLIAGLPLNLVLSVALDRLFNAFFGMSIFDLAQMSAQLAASGGAAGPGGDNPIAAAISPLDLLSFYLIAQALYMATLGPLFAIVAIAFRTCTGWVPGPSGNLPASPRNDTGA
jgi:hypothetical protein